MDTLIRNPADSGPKIRIRAGWIEIHRTHLPDFPEHLLMNQVMIHLRKCPVANILVYKPLRTEWKVADAIRIHFPRIRLWYPQITGGRMWAVSGRSFRQLAELERVIVPGLFINRNGFRIGRGGGWYDRELRFADRSRIYFIGATWQCLEFEPDPWDQRVGWWIHESGIIRF